MPSHDHERTPLLPSTLLPSSAELRAINVFELIHSVHAEIVRAFDSALSWEQVRPISIPPVPCQSDRSGLTAPPSLICQILAPDVNFSVLRPLLAQWASTKNPALSQSPLSLPRCLSEFGAVWARELTRVCPS